MAVLSTLQFGGLCILALILFQFITSYLSSPLKKIPGPFFARFTNLWRFWLHYRQTHIETHQALHKKYGKAVRVGPNVVSVSDAGLIKTIYNTRGTFVKSDYYAINDALQNGHIIQNVFSTRSNEFHTRQLKPIQKYYSFQSSLDLEPLMDDVIRSLNSELETRFMVGENKGKVFDIGEWVSYFTWDFLGDMTFSKRMGFMERGEDVGGMLETAERVMRYFSVVGQIPPLDHLLGKNPYLPSSLYKFPDFSIAAGFCVSRFTERMQLLSQYKGKRDFMNFFLAAKEEHPELVSDNEIVGYLILNILGGADTTAILLKACIYHILKNASVAKNLSAELRAADLPSPAPYEKLQHLPYLSACITEALRFHPVVGHVLERIVPSTGLTLSDGTVLPPGTIVGVNPWVTSRDTEIYGADAEVFRPERWLKQDGESEEEYQERTKRMRDADLSFGAGKRTCLGRPLALIELYKVVGGLFGEYDIELVDPAKDWTLHKQWFVWPHDIKVRMGLREEQ